MTQAAYDVVVIGSRAAGMLAAIRAHDGGLTIAIFEKSGSFGGTSAVSGGGLWIPNNADIADSDSPKDALDYLVAVPMARWIRKGLSISSKMRRGWRTI